MKLCYQPYVYLIGWYCLDKWYIGCRYAQGCHPNDLFNPYKTSSKYVKRFIEQHGNPDIIAIVETFQYAESAQMFEEALIRATHAAKLDRFLNRHTPSEKFYTTLDSIAAMKKTFTCEAFKVKMKAVNSQPDVHKNRSESSKRTRCNPEVNERITQSVRDRWNDPIKKQMIIDAIKTTLSTEEGKRVKSEASKRTRSDPVVNEKIRQSRLGKVWVNNGVENKIIDPLFLQSYLDKGWIKKKLNHKKTEDTYVSI